MKPKKFMPGQAVTPSYTKFNPLDETCTSDHSPKFGNIYHVKNYEVFDDGEWWVSLDEMSDRIAYEEFGFAPVITTHELEKDLSEIETSVAI